MSSSLTDGSASAGPLFSRARSGLAALDAVSRWLVIFAMAAMAALVIGQVFFRYALSNSIDWAEEMARLAFVWTIFLAIPHGVRRGIHVGIDVVAMLLPPAWQEAFFRIGAAFGAVLMAVVLIYGYRVTLDTWPELMPTVDVTAAVYYVAVVVAAAHSLLHLLLLSWGGQATWSGDDRT